MVTPPQRSGRRDTSLGGTGHMVLPGRLVRVVVLRRDGKPTPKQPGQRKPPPAIATFFTTDLT